MNKKALALAAGAMMLFAASCTNDNAATENTTNVDSIVNARVDSIRTQMMLSNDSMINAMAQYKADSMIAAAKGQAAPARPNTGRGTTGGTKPTTTTPSNDGRLNTQPANNDGRLNTKPATESKDPSRGSDGRLKTN